MLACAILGAAALVLPVDSNAPAFGSCAAQPVGEMRAEADATAVGTIVEIRKPRSPFGLGTPQGASYWFEVTQVYDGVVHELIEVDSAAGYDLDRPFEGGSYLLFLRGESPMFTADAFSSMPVPVTIPEAAEIVGDWAWTAPEPGGTDLPSASPPWFSIGLGALVLVMVVVLVIDPRRRTPDTAAVGGIDP